MSTVIRASDRNQAVQGVAFNFDDMSQRAGVYLEQIKQEAAKLVLQARQEATDIRQRAETEGRSAGLKLVDQLVDQKVGQQMQTLLPALQQAIQAIQVSKQAWLTQWEQRAVHLAAAMAARVIRQELTRAPEITLNLVREALELAAGGADVRVHLNPRDFDTVQSQLSTLTAHFTRLAPTDLVADPQISPGGCRVETRFGVVDQTWEAQLARIEQELT